MKMKRMLSLAAWMASVTLLAGVAVGQTTRPARNRPATSQFQPAERIELKTQEFGSVFYPGDKIELFTTIFTGGKEFPKSIIWTVTDADGKQVSTIQFNGPMTREALGVYQFHTTPFAAHKTPGLGYYTVEAKAGDLKGTVAFVVVPKPREMEAEKSCMGMVVSPTSPKDGDLAGYLHAGKRMGMRWASVDVAMSMYAPSADVLDFEKGAGRMVNLDTLADLATKENMVVNQKLFGVPAWLASDATDKCRSPWYKDCYTSPIKDKDAYAKVVTTMVTRYKGKIRSYEFGNSPFREDRYYCGTNEEFIRDLTWTHDAVKAGDPTVLVCAAGFVQKNTLVPELLKKAPNIIDVLTVHYITADAGEGREPQWYFAAPPSWYDVIFKEVGFRKPMWDTSAIGIPQDDLNMKKTQSVVMNTLGVSEEGILRSLVRNLANGVSRTMFSALNIPGTHQNIFTADAQPRTSVCEYAVAGREFDGAKFLQKMTLPGKLEGYCFQRGGDVFAVLWSNANGAGGKVELPAKGDSCVVVDRFGRETKAQASDGKVSMLVGFRPVIIHGLAQPPASQPATESAGK